MLINGQLIFNKGAIGFGNDFINMTPKAHRHVGLCQKTSEQLRKQKSKIKLMEWDKIFANHTYDEMLLLKYTRISYNSIPRKLITWFKDGQRTWIDIFQRRLTNGQQPCEEMLNVINKLGNVDNLGNVNQKHSEISFHLCEDGYCKKIQKTCVGEDNNLTNLSSVETLEHLYTVDRNAKWYKLYRNQYRSFSKIRNRSII